VSAVTALVKELNQANSDGNTEVSCGRSSSLVLSAESVLTKIGCDEDIGKAQSRGNAHRGCAPSKSTVSYVSKPVACVYEGRC
jgi:hypothetical protein